MNARRVFALFLLIAVACIAACTKWDVARIGRIVATRDVAGAERMAAEKAVRYAANPKALERDVKAFAGVLETFRKAIGGEWGEDEVRVPESKKYVKYTQSYLSRARVDFEKGMVTVETLDAKAPRASLKNAVVATLLAPYDPRAVDLYSAQPVKLGDTPFLYGEVRDHENKMIRWEWRAARFADHLIGSRLETRTTTTPKGQRTVHFVSFSMVRDHLTVRAKKYHSLVERGARKFGVSRNLIYAIMKTESDFNPYAVSKAPAFGLMQVVPGTAGSDVYEYLNKKKGKPSPAFLLKPANNVLYGSAYLHLLDTRYLKGIGDSVSREYCVISGYNGGAGSVRRLFGSVDNINKAAPGEVYRKLTKDHPFAETRRYLEKVVSAKRFFVNL